MGYDHRKVVASSSSNNRRHSRVSGKCLGGWSTEEFRTCERLERDGGAMPGAYGGRAGIPVPDPAVARPPRGSRAKSSYSRCCCGAPGCRIGTHVSTLQSNCQIADICNAHPGGGLEGFRLTDLYISTIGVKQ